MIEEIREKLSTGQFEFSKHAVDLSILRQVTLQDMRETITDGEIIEDYPDDKYGPSCLILGYTQGVDLCIFSAVTHSVLWSKSLRFTSQTQTSGLISR